MSSASDHADTDQLDNDGPDRAIAILLDSFGRARELVPTVLEGLTVEDLTWRPDAGANSIGWLVWHLTRVQDDHVAGLLDTEQVWTVDGWAARFGLPYADDAIGYGQTAEEVAAFTVDDAHLLHDYFSAVHASTVETLSAMPVEDLDRIVDASWDPPVTVAVRLVSVADDMAQHLGQAAYLRGMLERRPA